MNNKDKQITSLPAPTIFSGSDLNARSVSRRLPGSRKISRILPDLSADEIESIAFSLALLIRGKVAAGQCVRIEKPKQRTRMDILSDKLVAANKQISHLRSLLDAKFARNRSGVARPRDKSHFARLGDGTREEFKARVFERYGCKCECCGIVDRDLLTVDHIGGGGSKHRREVGNYYYQAILVDDPKKYRLLCMNCNWATRGGRTCPHKKAVPNAA